MSQPLPHYGVSPLRARPARGLHRQGTPALLTRSGSTLDKGLSCVIYLKVADMTSLLQRNCITLTGLFSCRAGHCSALSPPWECERRCPDPGLALATVAVLAGDRTVSARCTSASLVGSGTEIWRPRPDKATVSNVGGKQARGDGTAVQHCLTGV